MINMKQESKTKESVLCEEEQPDYPYGLCIELNNDSLTKLGVTELPSAGDSMLVTAIVQVRSVSQYDSAEGKERSASLQITDMQLDKEVKPAEKALYPNMG